MILLYFENKGVEESFTVLVNFKIPPPRKYLDLPVRKNVFDAAPKRCSDDYFSMSFSFRECISGQNGKSVYSDKKKSVHITANTFHIKLPNFVFYELWSSYKGGNDGKLTRPVKSPNIYEGGGKLS